MPRPRRGIIMNDDRCLSVRLSVCPEPDPKSRTEGRSKVKIGRREAHDTGDTGPYLWVRGLSPMLWFRPLPEHGVSP